MPANRFLPPTNVSSVNTTSAYGSGDVLGTQQSAAMSNSLGTQAYIDNLTLLVQGTVAPSIDILILKAPFTTPPTDNAAAALDEAELRANLIGRISVLAADFTIIAGSDILTCNRNIPPIVVSGGKSYTVVFILTAAYTPAVVNCLDLKLPLVEMQVGA